MTADDFRNHALRLPEASEGAHMGHADFRVNGKIFATLWPDGEWGVVIVTPEEQTRLLATAPQIFVPVKGGWGRRGSTQVRLRWPTKRSSRLLCSAPGGGSLRSVFWRSSIDSNPTRDSGDASQSGVLHFPR